MSTVVSKGEKTKTKIVETGLNWASKFGLSNLTIGKLASELSMSRSGLFSHFKSLKTLKMEILRRSDAEFERHVLGPNSQIEDPFLRLKDFAKRWFQWTNNCTATIDGGCPYINFFIEYDDIEGEVKGKIKTDLLKLYQYVKQLCELNKEAGYFRADVSSKQFAYDFFGIYLSQFFVAKIMEESQQHYFQRSFDDLINRSI